MSQICILFKQYGISNTMNGTENDWLWDIENKAEINFVGTE